MLLVLNLDFYYIEKGNFDKIATLVKADVESRWAVVKLHT